MRIPFSRKTTTGATIAKTKNIDPDDMALLMQSFREVLVKRLRQGWGHDVRVTPHGRLLVALPKSNAFVVGEAEETGELHILIQGSSGTPTTLTRDEIAQILSVCDADASVHLYSQPLDEQAEENFGVVIHPTSVDAIKLIPDLYQKARAHRALLRALKHLGEHV